MKIASITLRNFRRFGDSPTTVELAEDITALVGANGSGKTALFTALNRLFGTTQNMRTMRRSDFHLPPGGATDDPSALELSIEVVLIFPELSGDAEASNSVAPQKVLLGFSGSGNRLPNWIKSRSFSIKLALGIQLNLPLSCDGP